MARDIKGTVRLARRTALVIGASVAAVIAATPVHAAPAPEQATELVAVQNESGETVHLHCDRLDVRIAHLDSSLVIQNGHDHREVNAEQVKLARYSGSHTQKFQQCKLPGHEGFVYVSRHGKQCLQASAREGDRLRAATCTAGELQRFMKFYDEVRKSDAVQLSPLFSRGDDCLEPREATRGGLLETRVCAKLGENLPQLFDVSVAR